MDKIREIESDSIRADRIIACPHSEICYRNKITLLSFALAVLVVIRHTINIEVYDLSDGLLFWIEKYLGELTDIAVPTFFVLSGYLFYQNYTPRVLLNKWRSRLFSLLIPYLIWNGIGYLYVVVLSAIPAVKERLTEPVDGLSMLTLLKEMFIGEHIFVTWFLRCLIVYTIVTPLLYWFLKNKKIAIIAFLLILVVLSIINKQIVNNWIFYVFGACLGIHGKAIVKAKYKSGLFLCCCVYLTVSCLFGLFFEYKQITVYSILRLSQVVAVWVCADIFSVKAELKWWLKISFFIYVCHGMVLESVEKVFLIVLGKNIWGAAIDLFFAPVVALFILVLLAFVLEKVKPLWSVLTGSRG